MQSVILNITVLILISGEILGFNLNTLHSIIYEDAHKNMSIYTDKKSLFGYTTALYHDGRGGASIFIGAPKGVDSRIPAHNPGVVFRCRLKQQCEMLTLDHEYGVTSYRGYKILEYKDDAWIGGTMDINLDTSTLVICGFRWSYSNIFGTGKSMIGVCYLSNLKPDNIQFQKLLPLINSAKATWHYGDTSVYFYYLGEAGFSAHITGHKQHPELLLGAPGLLNWYGGAALYKNLNSLLPLNPKVLRQQKARFGLFGYAVSSGKYNGPQDIYYASSAPQADGVGLVIIYKFGFYNDSLIHDQFMLYGTQVGEYFGGALMSGDLNNDGYDDLIVGAPFYSNVNFNEGRIHIYYGGRESNNFNDKEGVVHIEGTITAGQYGTVISYLGDLNQDGYGDVAVGAPYSNNHRGTVFIYHGSRSGLNTIPSQVLEAREIDNRLRGFGISISKAVDIDGNRFLDLAIGSHLSGHAVIIRANPIISIQTYLEILEGTKINVGNTTISHCFNHTGNAYITNSISIRRTLIIDEKYKRLALIPPTLIIREVILKNFCETFLLVSKEKLNFLREPVKISVHYEIIEEQLRKSNYYVGFNNTDTFCKTCPILSNMQPYETEFAFALGCGDDDVCSSNLNFDATFTDLSEDGTYVIGSKDVIRMDIQVINYGDSAYLTQVFVSLPENVQFNSIPKKCEEIDHGILNCLVGNPLNNHTIIPIFLTVKDVRAAMGTNLKFEVNVTTSSENINPQKSKHFTIPLGNVVDLQLMGKTISPLTFYTENTSFTHVYEIQKRGVSPAEQVAMVILVPTHIMQSDIEYPIVKLYSINGSLSGQPVHCKNSAEVDYIIDVMSETPMEPDLIEIDDKQAIFRNRRSIDPNIVYTNNLNMSITESPVTAMNEYSSDCKFNAKCVSLDCIDPDSGIICSPFICEFGTIRSSQDIGVVRIKAFLNTTLIKQIFGENDEILLVGFGDIYSSLDHDGNNNKAIIINSFLQEAEYWIDLWILVCATIAGLVLLMLFTFVLYKAGFFTRKKKLQMEEEKKQVAIEEFQNARLSGEPSPDYLNETEMSYPNKS